MSKRATPQKQAVLHSGLALWLADPVDSSLYLPTSRAEDPQRPSKPLRVPKPLLAQPLAPTVHHQSCPLNKNFPIPSLPKGISHVFPKRISCVPKIPTQ